MFNIEKVINNWKKSLRKNRSLEEGYIEELESHLRDLMEEKINKGINEKEAFEASVKELGKINEIGNEYFKSDTTNKISGRPSWHPPKWMPQLWWSYFKTCIRVIKRHVGYSFISIFGLVIGITCFVLITAYVFKETGYDDFNENSSDVYRVAVERNYPSGKTTSAATQRPLAEYLDENFPEVVQSVRISKERAEKVIVHFQNKSFYEEKFLFADKDIFEVFPAKFISGNPNKSLSAPFSIVITKSAAIKYFGSAKSEGKTIDVKFRGGNEFHKYHITGIVEDQNFASHFHYDFIASYIKHPYVGEADEQDNWGGLDLYTYLLLRDNTDIERFEKKLNLSLQEKMFPIIQRDLGIPRFEKHQSENYNNYFLQPLKSIHLYSNYANEIEINGDINSVILFGVIALIALVLASVNFINLSTARASTRMKEMGVRKTIGAQKKQLIGQFITEALIFVVFSFIISQLIVPLILPIINSQMDLDMIFDIFRNPSQFYVIAGVVILVGIASSIYPARYISSINPAIIVKGIYFKGDAKSKKIRNGLIVFQFIISITMIICTLILIDQYDYLRNKKLGFEKESILVIDGTEFILRNKGGFFEEIKSNPAVLEASNAQAVPGNSFGTAQIFNEEKNESESITVNWLTAGGNYVSTLGLSLILGRDFSDKIASDSMSVILNEKAVSALGLNNPLYKSVVYEDRSYNIIGVVKDFNFGSLHDKINPLAIFGPDPFNSNRPNQSIVLRVRSNNISSLIGFLEEGWNRYSNGEPFKYSFLNEDLEALYKKEMTARNLFMFFTAAAITIACFGLFGLAAFSAKQRNREIGTRKVLGATTTQIIILLLREFIVLILLAFIAAAGISYFFMEQWLNGYANRTDISLDHFIIAGLLTLVLTLFAAGFQAVKAAIDNPLKSMKYE